MTSAVVGGEIEGGGFRAHGLVAFYQKKDFDDKDLICFLFLTSYSRI